MVGERLSHSLNVFGPYRLELFVFEQFKLLFAITKNLLGVMQKKVSLSRLLLLNVVHDA